MGDQPEQQAPAAPRPPRAIEVAGLIGHLVPMTQRFRSMGMVLPGVEASIPMLHALHTILLEREANSDPRTLAASQDAPPAQPGGPWPTKPADPVPGTAEIPAPLGEAPQAPMRPPELDRTPQATPPAGMDANAVLSHLLSAMRARGYSEPSAGFYNFGMDLRVAYGPRSARQVRVLKLDKPFWVAKVMQSLAPRADDDQDQIDDD
jgi:hypothetical protein